MRFIKFVFYLVSPFLAPLLLPLLVVAWVILSVILFVANAWRRANGLEPVDIP